MGDPNFKFVLQKIPQIEIIYLCLKMSWCVSNSTCLEKKIPFRKEFFEKKFFGEFFFSLQHNKVKVLFFVGLKWKFNQNISFCQVKVLIDMNFSFFHISVNFLFIYIIIL